MMTMFMLVSVDFQNDLQQLDPARGVLIWLVATVAAVARRGRCGSSPRFMMRCEAPHLQ